MHFENRHGEQITTVADWRRLGSPAAAHHWKPGRSAYELAVDWIEHDAVDRVTALLGLAQPGAQVVLARGVVEKKTYFDRLRGGPRNHDLLIHGSCGGAPLIISVESKADEPFGRPLWRWRQIAVAKNPRSGAPRRLDHLTTLFFGTTIDTDHAYPPLACTGYQLLSALAGTLADAKMASARRGMVLVHEFVTDETLDDKHAVNERVLEDFLTRFYGASPQRACGSNAWITTPVTATGDGDRMAVSLELTFAKLVTNTRTRGDALSECPSAV